MGTLQQSVWSNGLFLSLLSLWRWTICSNWRKYPTWKRNRERDGLQKQYIDEKSYFVVEMWQWFWWKLCKTALLVKEQIKNNSHTNVFCVRTRNRTSAMFGCVKCDVNVPKHRSRERFANFAPISTNAIVCRQEIGLLKQDYAEKEEILTQQQRLLILRFELTNRPINTHLQLYYLELGLVCLKS